MGIGINRDVLGVGMFAVTAAGEELNARFGAGRGLGYLAAVPAVGIGIDRDVLGVGMFAVTVAGEELNARFGAGRILGYDAAVPVVTFAFGKFSSVGHIAGDSSDGLIPRCKGVYGAALLRLCNGGFDGNFSVCHGFRCQDFTVRNLKGDGVDRSIFQYTIKIDIRT